MYIRGFIEAKLVNQKEISRLQVITQWTASQTVFQDQRHQEDKKAREGEKPRKSKPDK